MVRKIFIAFIFLTSPSFLISQTFEGTFFNQKNGLLDNDAYSLFQDKKGFIWIWTTRGLNVYDGKSIKVFPDNIDQAVEGQDGLIYTASRGCINKYSPLKKVETLKTYWTNDLFYIKDKDAFKQINKFSDSEGTIYYYMHEEGVEDTITLYLNNSLKKVLIKEYISKGFYPQFFNDRTNRLWVMFQNSETRECKLFYFEKGNLVLFNSKFHSKFNANNIYYSKKNELFIFSNEEVLKITKNNYKVIKLPVKEGLFFSQTNLCFKEDSKGNIWFPYEKGLAELSFDSVFVLKDDGNRPMTCDFIPESFFDANGVEKIEMKWFCDARVYNTALEIDSEDRIYNGNKVYENGKFHEIFQTDKTVLIYGIYIDKENNLWYNTTSGVYKYNRLPLTDLSQQDKIFGNLVAVDLSGRLFVENQYKGWSNRSRIQIYESDSKGNAYKLIDSVILRDEKKYDKDIDWQLRFTAAVPARNGTLIFSEECLYTFDGKSHKKIDIDHLNFSKFPFLFGRKNLNIIKKYSIFTDEDDNVWFYYKGNYIKSDGKQFWCFGKESGLKDSMLYGGSYFNETGLMDFAKNIRLSKDCFYVLKDDKFTAFNYKENNIPEEGLRTVLFSDGKKGVYFFIDSLSSLNKKATLMKFENSKFTKYKFINPENLPIRAGAVKPYANKFIFDCSDPEGFIMADINDKDRTITLSRFNVAPENHSLTNRIAISNNKLFVFSLNDAARIFPLDASTNKAKEPLVLQDYYTFDTEPICFEDYIYINDPRNLESKNIILKFDLKAKYFNEVEPITSVLGMSFETNEVKTELFHDFDGTSIPFHFNPFKIFFKGISMREKGKVKYKYFLEGLDTKWNEINEDNITYSSLSPGQYKFKVIACNNNGVWNETPAEFSFTILPPWYRTWYAYGCYILAGFMSIRGYIRNRTKKLEKEKAKLEATVEERTAEVVQQKHLLEEKNKEIIDSITYARRIQRSLLPTEKYIERVLNKDPDKKDKS